MLLKVTVTGLSGQISEGPDMENSGLLSLSAFLMMTATDPVASGAKSSSALSSLIPFPLASLSTVPFWTVCSSPRTTSSIFALDEQVGPRQIQVYHYY